MLHSVVFIGLKTTNSTLNGLLNCKDVHISATYCTTLEQSLYYNKIQSAKFCYNVKSFYFISNAICSTIAKDSQNIFSSTLTIPSV